MKRLNNQRRQSGGRAFTLLETMMALVIIGVGVLAFVDAHASFSRSNGWSSQAATGMLLANEIREMTRRLPRHDPVTGLTLSGGGGSAVVAGWGREATEVAISDIDDLDDLDGMTFGAGGTFAGPIDGFGNLVQEISPEGMVVIDPVTGEGAALPGWTQSVVVQKVDPYNFNTIRNPNYVQDAGGAYPAINVDEFPVRVTVTVRYQGAGDTQAIEITKLTWVVSP